MVSQRLVLLGLSVFSVILSAHGSPRWYSHSTRKEAGCGYEACPAPKEGMINVHLVPHSHDDVGWLKTVDQYYYGSRNSIQKAGVQYILDSVVQELVKDPSRRFVYVESAFMHKWYMEQTAELQQQVKMLVDEGRLEFIGGAWSMNDEAAVHYQSVVDQFTWGLRFLNDTFGECGRPRIGWQIDPFGHSREQASLFTQMGYDGLFFARLDYQDKNHRMQTRTPEMVWHTSGSLGNSDLFTSVLYNHYSAPPGFCFDILCNDDPMIDDKGSTDYNVKNRIDTFITWLEKMAESYRSNNLILSMGDDFNYMDAIMNFKNMDKLIKYTNERQAEGSKINAFYSTPSCYVKAVHSANIDWPTKSDDFFPYESDYHSFWTGYYTSRPTQKRYEREGNHFLQVCKQLSAIAPTKESFYEDHLTVLRDAMGVMQHHDAITGTEKQHVADDYARMLYEAFEACSANTRSALNQLSGERDSFKFDWTYCKEANVSACALTESSDNNVVLLYNPLGHSTDDFVRLPVKESHYVVRNDRGQTVPSTLIPIPSSVLDLPFRHSAATHELVFHAESIAPVGYRSFYVSKEAEKKDASSSIATIRQEEHVSIGNDLLTVHFDENGFMSSITVDGATHPLKQNFLFYDGAYGNNEEFKNRSSGAYIFRPNGTEKAVTEVVELQVVKSELVQEVHQIFNEWISQVIRVYAGQDHVELEWLVGPIPIDDGTGKEIVSRFESDIASEGVFWTDSNGREMLRRVRNKRETWELDLLEPVSGNYYPITAKLALEDDHFRMSLLNDRAQGGSSLQDGQLELMVHRRLLRDDAFGVGEALNETQYGAGLVARGKHWLYFGSSQKAVSPTLHAKERFLQNKVLLPSWTFVNSVDSVLSYDDYLSNFRNIYSAIAQQLPTNVNLLTLEPWKDGTVLVRFEHLFEKNEDPVYSQAVRFNVRNVLFALNIESIHETTLGANQWKEDSVRLQFTTESTANEIFDNVFETENIPIVEETTDFDIELQPMEIRTFVVKRR
ncbi:lysosomal alpha-mannosidase-like [Anopheles ziemanni]|uniref:lysosomal alpha-mannosidase-like n=1 Tax=Anopheles coustani TaxID=139045 RepID=UPI0026599806|nr:lysosomal alpha-mannosidase-like [Anopheles coustani]XP_058168098.1 lysosomal alpha-mannosidase-like [Anopheles ziemanni]